jgi:hypothetical protein
MLLLPLLAVMAGADQTVPPPEQPRAPVEPRKNQRIERLHVEDRGVRIDELRYGGQTQSVVVQPKGDMPEYESQPTDLARSRPADKRDGLSSATGQRVWNVFKF